MSFRAQNRRGNYDYEAYQTNGLYQNYPYYNNDTFSAGAQPSSQYYSDSTSYYSDSYESTHYGYQRNYHSLNSGNNQRQDHATYPSQESPYYAHHSNNSSNASASYWGQQRPYSSHSYSSNGREEPYVYGQAGPSTRYEPQTLEHRQGPIQQYYHNTHHTSTFHHKRTPSSPHKGFGVQTLIPPRTTPTPSYLSISLKAPSTVSIDDATPKLVILDLNGTLVVRSARSGPNPKNRQVYSRPYLGNFVDYLLHPNSGYEAMVWSSAQPQNVDDMVTHSFGPNKAFLRAIWARDTLGLSSKDFNKKVQTNKDLSKIWSKITPKPSAIITKTKPAYSALNTLLIDDSPLKATQQPHNHICMPEYSLTQRSHDLDFLMGIPNGQSSQGAGIPEAVEAVDRGLLGVIGILDEIGKWDNVAGWVRSGGLLVDPTQKRAEEETMGEIAKGKRKREEKVEGESVLLRAKSKKQKIDVVGSANAASSSIVPTELHGSRTNASAGSTSVRAEVNDASLTTKERRKLKKLRKKEKKALARQATAVVVAPSKALTSELSAVSDTAAGLSAPSTSKPKKGKQVKKEVIPNKAPDAEEELLLEEEFVEQALEGNPAVDAMLGAPTTKKKKDKKKKAVISTNEAVDQNHANAAQDGSPSVATSDGNAHESSVGEARTDERGANTADGDQESPQTDSKTASEIISTTSETPPPLLWFQEPAIFEYWVQRGIQTLQRLGIQLEIGDVTAQ